MPRPLMIPTTAAIYFFTNYMGSISHHITPLELLILYSGKILRTINFAVFEDFTTTSKINSLKSYYSTSI